MILKKSYRESRERIKVANLLIEEIYIPFSDKFSDQRYLPKQINNQDPDHVIRNQEKTSKKIRRIEVLVKGRINIYKYPKQELT